MRVFVTGASGFVGSAIVSELLRAGHQVLGMVRSDSGAEKITKAGAETHRADLDDLAGIREAAKNCDAVIHTAFKHDFSNFKASCETDRKVIGALGEALAGSNRPLVVTSAIGLLNLGRLVTEDDVAPGADLVARAATEEAARAVAQKAVKTYIVRLPPTTHDKGDHGFVPIVMGMAKQQGRSAYIGEGLNRWPAVHRQDAAVLYRLIIEQQPEQMVYHAAAEEGICFKEIATAIGKGLDIRTVSKSGKEAEAHFTWFLYFASLNCPASAGKTRQTVGWEPTHPGLMDELVPGIYF